MNKLYQIIQEMNYEDLSLIKKDIQKGNLTKLLKEREKEINDNRITICPVCNTPVKEGEGWHLQFGPKGLRKKATFDGPDCLAYFLDRLKKK